MRACTCILPAVLLVTSLWQAVTAAGSTSVYLKIQEQQPCEPWTVEPEDRCSYVIEHAGSCYPDGGWQLYLRYHFCTFQNWEWCSLLILLSGVLFSFGVLLTISERFFCPALELISEYLKLPPVVAGATLLSFGNGAPDIFTQVAAVGQGGNAAVGMALAEPLGGGLFTTNIVFGLVVLLGAAAKVQIQRIAFMKDVAFYLACLLLVMAMTADGKVVLWETAVMGLVYITYVFTTFWVSRHDEPVHADVAHHEVPLEEGVDVYDSCSEAGWVDTPVFADAATSVHRADLEAAVVAAADQHYGDDHRPPSPSRYLTPRQGASPPRKETLHQAKSDSTISWLKGAFWSKARSFTGLREPLLSPVTESPSATPQNSAAGHITTGVSLDVTYKSTQQTAEPVSSSSPVNDPDLMPAGPETGSIDEEAVPISGIHSVAESSSSSVTAAGAAADSSGDSKSRNSTTDPGAQLRLRRQSRDSSTRHKDAAMQSDPGDDLAARAASAITPRANSSVRFSSAVTDSSEPAYVHLDMPSPRIQSERAAPLGDRSLRRFKTFTEGVGSYSFKSSATAAAAAAAAAAATAAAAAGDSALAPILVPSPRAGSESGSALQSPLSVDALMAAAIEDPSELLPKMHQLQEQHVKQQEDLLNQQAEEHLVLMQLHEEEQEIKSQGWSLKHKLQQPLTLILSCTMPRVGTGPGHRYQRWKACLLPFTAPLTLFVAAPGMFDSIGQAGMLYALACGSVGSAVIWATYPASSVPRKSLKGVFAVMTFFQAIMWLNISASCLVQLCVIMGVIFGVKPALLGATVLAYGNSVPDLMNNLSLARDGFPSMAVAACFASPMFSLTVGLASALAYGAVLNHGALLITLDAPLLVMMIFGSVNLLKYLLAVPFLYKYKMSRKMSITAFLYYACFNVVYGLVIANVVDLDSIRKLWPWHAN